ncbi:TatD family hydrolase [Candidatus Woesearchaeota archaeon]|nr:TatD family hydrolase [Candidatus Woesearchaeota archaeon]
MKLVDVHAHLDIFSERDRKAVMARAAGQGVTAILSNGGNPDSNRKTLQLQEKYEIVKAAVGIYPADAAEMSYADIDKELKFIKKNFNKIKAIGEIGLDYEKTSERSKQQDVFESQLALGKPVIVHSRKAEEKVVETLISSNCKNAVLHAFHGSMKLVRKAADAGFYFSIPTNIARSQHFQTLAAAVDLTNLLTETDAPYLAAEKGSKSEPADVAATIQEIAKIKNLKPAAVAETIYKNYRTLFKQ